MKISNVKQRSEDWFELKRGKIGGTRFSNVISNRKNGLLYELLNERLSPWIDNSDEYVSEEMQFGIDNEAPARKLYSKQSGIKFEEVGAILSDFSEIHLASPDGVNIERGIVLEIKCTMNGAVHLARFFEGVDDKYMAQIKNYFAVSDDVKEVHFVSYCPDRHERPIIQFAFTRDMFVDDLQKWRDKVKSIEEKLNKMQLDFTF